MPARLVPQDGGPEILMDRAMVIVGRHPSCDARLDSPRISRRHCCMTPDQGQLWVRDLGSTNGIRINGQRVDSGWLKHGDELSIAHMRFRFEMDPVPKGSNGHSSNGSSINLGNGSAPIPLSSAETVPGSSHSSGMEGPLVEAIRSALPPELAAKLQIQVILKVPEGEPIPNGPEHPSTAPETSDEP